MIVLGVPPPVNTKPLTDGGASCYLQKLFEFPRKFIYLSLTIFPKNFQFLMCSLIASTLGNIVLLELQKVQGPGASYTFEKLFAGSNKLLTIQICAIAMLNSKN